MSPIYTDDRVGDSFLEEYPSGLGETLGASFKQSWLSNPLSSLDQMGELGEARYGALGPWGQRREPDSPVLDADAARQKIKDAGVDLSVPENGIPSRALDILIKRKSDERLRQNVLDRAPPGFGAGAARLGAMFAASALDPINVAASFVPVVGEARVARLLGQAAGPLERAGVRAGVGAVEGAAGAALVEPIVYANQQQSQNDYALADSLLNIALGSALGGGLHVGVGAVGDAIGRGLAWQRTRAEDAPIPRILDDADYGTREAALRASVAQMADGRRVEVEPVVTYEPQRDLGVMQAAVTEPQPIMASGAEQSASASRASFQTAKGSVYVLNDDGTTTRDKAYRPEHGAAEQGPQPRSERTFYVTPEDAQRLGEFQARGPEREIAQTTDGRWGVRYREGSGAGKFERRTVVEAQSEPAVGLIPVEMWNNGRRVHFGNEIVSISGAQGAETIASRPPRAASTLNMRSKVEGSFAPEAALLYDDTAIRASISREANFVTDERMPDDTLEAAIEDVNRLAEGLGDPELVARELKPYDELQQTAEEYGRAVAAAAECRLRRGA